MRLKHYLAEQFAGMREADVSFSDGMNVILGSNEAGKSTMISAIYSILFVPSKLDKRKNKDFMELFFPSSHAATIDATLEFSHQGKEYSLTRVWDRNGTESAVKLTQAGGAVSRGTEAESKLKEILQYGAAVYGNLIFGRQNYIKEILAWCFDFFASRGEDAAEVRNVIAAAFSAAGGISEDKLASALESRMKSMSGRWDFEKDQPEGGRGIERPWSNGKGSILEAYYAFKSAEQEYAEAVCVEEELAVKNQRYAQLTVQRVRLEEQQKNLQKQQETMQSRIQIQKLLEVVGKVKAEAIRAQEEWPGLAGEIKKAQMLLRQQAESERRKRKQAWLSQREEAQKLQKEIAALSEKVHKNNDILEDYQKADRLSRALDKYRAILGSAKLHADIEIIRPYSASLHLADGSIRTVEGLETMDIDGVFQVVIPNVGAFRISPQDLDVDSLIDKMQEEDQQLQQILKKYGAASLEDLETAKNEHQRTAILLNGKIQMQKKQVLTVTELQAEIDRLELDLTIEMPDSLEDETAAFLKTHCQPSLEACVAAMKAQIDNFESEYGALDQAAQREQDAHKELLKYQRQLAQMDELQTLSPEEYQSKAAGLQKSLKETEETTRQLQKDIITLQVSQKDLSEISEWKREVEKYREAWQNEKKKYQGYQQIKADIKKLQEESGDKFAKFNQKFDNYLGAITGNTLSMIPASGLELKSKNNQISDQRLLSEGTKKTILLAFRLAVLEYFFPEGGGLMVLDDDLLDLDPGRRNQAARLLKEFAENHQVIAATCDPAIADLLGGNQITLSHV